MLREGLRCSFPVGLGKGRRPNVTVPKNDTCKRCAPNCVKRHEGGEAMGAGTSRGDGGERVNG